jgi:hypothetical protein
VHLFERECGGKFIGPKTVPIVIGRGIQVLVTDARTALNEKPVAGAMKAANNVAPSVPVSVNKLAGATEPELHTTRLLFSRFAQTGPEGS